MAAEVPVLVSLLVGDDVSASFALAWRNDIERAVLVTAVAVLALDVGADSVVAARRTAVGREEVAVATGHGVQGPEPLAALLVPLRDLLPPHAGFCPLPAEVEAAQRNLAPCAVPATASSRAGAVGRPV